MNQQQTIFDAAIVGAGFGGLGAAAQLTRAYRARGVGAWEVLAARHAGHNHLASRNRSVAAWSVRPACRDRRVMHQVQ